MPLTSLACHWVYGTWSAWLPTSVCTPPVCEASSWASPSSRTRDRTLDRNNVDIFSLPQPFLMGLRKHCPKQCKLPTIQEQEDAQRQEGHAQGKYSNGMPTEGESRAGAVDGTSGEWQGWRTLDDTEEEEEEEEEEELEDELWDCNMRNPVNGDGIQKYLKSVVHSGVGKSSFSQSKQPIGRKIDDHVSPQSTNQT
ncbi:hypothetical protein J4Q44_G00073890 [Coregonus suidteri]|uniref:Uncharacterized protein n=1 Tax=Coregonus suidteri TaxID=861788 RepID=A0AAN8RCX4_9TELE